MKNLPPLRYGNAIQMRLEDNKVPVLTNVIKPSLVETASGKKWDKWWFETSSVPLKDGLRGHIRSFTFKGIAEAMANAWG